LRCWLSGPWIKGNLEGVSFNDHYSMLNICCSSYNWTSQNDTNVGGGTYVDARDINECKAACVTNDTCVGFDWNPGLPLNQQCWLSPNGSTTQDAVNIVHYSLNRLGCSVTLYNTSTVGSSPLTMSTTTPANLQGCTWTLFANTHYFDGRQVTTANSEPLCKNACVSYPGCTGVDFNSADKTCWLSGSWSGIRESVPGDINHYELRRNPGCA
jgi:hypothetical protein